MQPYSRFHRNTEDFEHRSNVRFSPTDWRRSASQRAAAHARARACNLPGLPYYWNPNIRAFSCIQESERLSASMLSTTIDAFVSRSVSIQRIDVTFCNHDGYFPGIKGRMKTTTYAMSAECRRPRAWGTDRLSQRLHVLQYSRTLFVHVDSSTQVQICVNSMQKCNLTLVNRSEFALAQCEMRSVAHRRGSVGENRILRFKKTTTNEVLCYVTAVVIFWILTSHILLDKKIHIHG